MFALPPRSDPDPDPDPDRNHPVFALLLEVPAAQNKTFEAITDPKRAMSVGINFRWFNKTFPMSDEEIVRHILHMEPQIMDETRALEALSKIIPEKDEVARLLEYSGDPEKCDRHSKWFLAVCEIPMLDERVQCAAQASAPTLTLTPIPTPTPHQTAQLDERISTVLRACEAATEALEAIENEPRLRAICLEVLTLGNMLNDTNTRGGAFAVRLSIFAKLKQHLGNDGKTSLLDFLIRSLEGEDPPCDFARWYEGCLPALTVACKVPAAQLPQDMASIRSSVQQLATMAQAVPHHISDHPDRFHTVMEDAHPHLHPEPRSSPSPSSNTHPNPHDRRSSRWRGAS